MQHVETQRATVPCEMSIDRVAIRMPAYAGRTARIRKHVEDVKLGRQLPGVHFAGQMMTPGETVVRRNVIARVPGAERLLLVPGLFATWARSDEMDIVGDCWP